MPKILKLESIENASVIRKFSVIFALVSFFPFVILASLFFLLSPKGGLRIDSGLFFWAVFIAGLLAFIGFLIMRKTLVGLIQISRDAQDIAKGNLSKRIELDAHGDNEVSQLARTFNEVVRQLENNIKQLEQSRAMVQEVLMRVASGVSSTENVDAFLDLILETTVHALDGNTGLLMTVDGERNELVVKSSYGLSDLYASNKRIPIDEEVAGWVIKQKKPLLVPRLHKTDGSAPSVPSAFEPPLICAPLVFQNKVVGAVSISGKKQDMHFKEDELIILSNLASQVALAIENARLNANNIRAYLETITALALAVEARDVYSRGHSDRVGDYAVKIAHTLGLDERKVQTIKEAAQLHDVGKIGISDDILRKPDDLNELERNIMEQHPIIGEGIIVPLQGLAHLKEPVRHHHEWLNGQGYPDHLKGEALSLEARILAVADSFDAMITNRPYRKAMTPLEAKEDLLKHKGIRYDAAVVDALIRALNL
ncbi:MAG TPA: HD domain-containing phosphohydrolase [Patescibacteria group bacterium]|nr:HD domain-containing phosphohydrolase [Patescibacteria group bacterium]